ncbi:MAG: outer membrane beta-barrel protein [Bacteroidota bacterium]
MKSLLFILLAGLLLTFSFAPAAAQTINGFIKDQQNEPVPGATITLYRHSDSTVVQRKAANGQGKFEFTALSNGTYFLKATAIGNKDYSSTQFRLDESHRVVAFPAIILLPAKGNQLKEVVVAAKRPLIQEDIDRTIINVDAMISASTSNTLDVLGKTPGVLVATDGSVSLYGRGGVLVLIDGRSTYLSGQDLAAYLRSLPGGSLDKIELMPNPSAKYDAGSSAIINIVLKKNRVQGINGSAYLTFDQGQLPRSFNSLNVNYLHQKLNFFSGLTYYKNDTRSEDVFNRSFFTGGAAPASSAISNVFDYRGHSLLARTGMDYAASKRTAFGLIASLAERPHHDRVAYTNDQYGASGALDSVARGTSNGDFTWRQFSSNLNFTHRFNDAGKELSADLNYIYYFSRAGQQIPNQVYLPNGTLQRNDLALYFLPSGKNIYTAKVDYTLPLPAKAKLEMGLKSSFVTNDNEANYFKVIGGQNIADNGRSNHFIYREDVQAAYINSRKEWKNLGVQFGLRLEATRSSGHQLGNAGVTGSTFTNSYTNVFPSVFLQYKLDNKNNQVIGLSFAQRLIRPNYQQLNPFLTYVDNYTYSSGNPNLQPVRNEHMEMTWRYRQLLNIRMAYDVQKNAQFDATHSLNGIFITQPDNLDGSSRMIGIRPSLMLPVTTAWNANLYLSFEQDMTTGGLLPPDQHLTIYTGTANLINNFSFAHGWSAEISGIYVGRQERLQRITDPRWKVYTATKKKIWKGKGAVEILFEDVFHSWITNETITGLAGVKSLHRNTQDTQGIFVALTYNFGNELFARRNKHQDNAADAEKGRIDQ